MTKTAGMFIELGRVKQSAPQESILQNVADLPLPDVDQVVAYLKDGHVLIDFMDISDDVFDKSRQIVGGPSTMTDGDWIWRDDFAYYVARHHVIVPAEFLDLIRLRQYVVPDVDEPTLDRIADEAVHLMS
jgi:hypothetical protein